jgi:hypothetical protein
MTHNAGFKSDDDNWEYYPPNELWETRQVMLAQGREIKALKEIVKDLDAQINGLTKRYEWHTHQIVEAPIMQSTWPLEKGE